MILYTFHTVTRRATVLIVDDNDDVLESMQLALERAGYEVATASNGLRAVELQRRSPRDILITDLFMPEADGLETIQRFKSEFPSVRIVAISGGGVRIAGRGYLATAEAAGADAVLPKPFEIPALLATLRTLAPPA